MALPTRQRPNVETKMLGNDRVLKLHQAPVKEGHKVPDPGLIGREIFNGNNNLHAMYDTDTGLWHFKLDRGDIPEGLKQRFTSFAHAYKHAKTYFAGKKIEVTEE